GKLLPDRVHSKTVLKVLPCVVRKLGVEGIVTVTEPSRGASASGTFPFRLGRQTIATACGKASGGEFALSQSCTVIGRIRPAHTGHRTAKVTGKLAGVRVHD